MQHSTLLALALAARAAADCACGYTVNKTSDDVYTVFTDMIETDFLHTYDFENNTAHSIGWMPQTYNQSDSSGPFGMAKMADNVVTNPLMSIWDWGGEGLDGGDPGLQLWVKTDTLRGDGLWYVPTAEIVSERDDILYGSFRIAMKTTNVNGTCAAFFFYRNDTQEIDVELLSAEQFPSRNQFPVNMVVQDTNEPLALNSSRSNNFQYHMLDQPNGGLGAQYREYRFDWLPDRIDFYVDNWHTMTFTDDIPSTPGAIHFSHWSNGNPGWSYGPPMEDAVMTVAYIKAYFNTTSPPPLSGHDCSSPQWRSANNAVCEIPDQTSPLWPGSPLGNQTGHSFFFSRQLSLERNMTNDDDDENHGPRKGSAEGTSMMRQKALWTFVAAVGALLFLALMCRFM